MIRIQNTGVFIILLTIFETLVTDQDFNHPHQSHLYPGKCRNVRHSYLGKGQKDKKYLNRSRGSQARWELAAFPHKSPSIADYIIGVHLFTQIWFIKVFFLTQIQYELEIHNITHWAIPAQKISFTERCMEYVLQSNSSPQSKVSNGNGANGALLALASCVIPVLVVTTMPLLADAHSTGTDPEVARWS